MPRRGPYRGRASFANDRNFAEVGLHQCPSERKGEGGPVRSLHVPSHVPSHPQNAAKVRAFARTASAFTAETDWLLEEGGFEPLVPLATEMLIELARGISKQLGCWRSATWGRCRGCAYSESGTSGSNPLSSSRQSVSAVNVEAVREKPCTLAAFCGWLGT